MSKAISEVVVTPEMKQRGAEMYRAWTDGAGSQKTEDMVEYIYRAMADPHWRWPPPYEPTL